MCKMKLKNVPISTEEVNGNPQGESPDLFSFSGFVDESGNVVDEGEIKVYSDIQSIDVGAEPRFEVTVEWNSGVVSLPYIPTFAMNGGYEPVVPVNLDKNRRIVLLNGSGSFQSVVGQPDCTFYWYTPYDADVIVSATLINNRGVQMRFSEKGYLSIPWQYIPPEKNDPSIVPIEK